MSDKEKTLNRIKELGLLAVLRGHSPELTIKMVDALIAGGVYGIEVTYSTPGADDVVCSLVEKYGDAICIGMGTLTTPAQANEALQAGAQFLVSPHVDTDLAHAMTATGLPVMMGALTPGEVWRSYTLGSDVVKLFPGSLGGPAHMKALKGPFPDIPMMPTGGVDKSNLGAWFAAGAVAVGAGSQLCPPNLATQGRFDEITEIAREFVIAIAEARRD